MKQLDEIEDQMIIDKFYLITGPRSVADIATRAGVRVYEISE